MTDLAPTIGTAAGQPRSATVDGLTATAQPLGDQIRADQYLGAKDGRASKRRGLMFNKLIPAGPVSDQQGTGLGGLGTFGSPGGIY